MPAGRILVVEDRESLRKMLARALRQEGYQVETAGDSGAAIGLVGGRPFDLILTDLKLPSGSGLDVLEASRQAQPQVPVVVLTAYGTVHTAVEAMKLGAADFLEKPVEIEDLFRLTASLLAGEEKTFAVDAGAGSVIVGRHPRMRAALKFFNDTATTESTVLLTGESGTGKELFAKALHALSPRREGPFVAVNCAAIPETLLENELFGHEKGAFTGASRRQLGRFEAAAGGTLLLDEVGDLGAATQAKVLRVLEERTFERIGGGRTLHADVRLVAATNQDLQAMVDEGTFRSDLYFRLDVFPIELPPLRERRSDVALLARYLLERIAGRQGRPLPQLADAAVELLSSQRWPGNVRQLGNVLERAVILAEGPRLNAADLRPLLSADDSSDELQRIREALRQTGGDKKEAAELLDISYRTLQRRVKALDLEGYPKYRD
jgi:DNA-binding NtrC family response regulator